MKDLVLAVPRSLCGNWPVFRLSWVLWAAAVRVTIGAWSSTQFYPPVLPWRPSFQLHCEGLEPRCCPSTVYFDSTNYTTVDSTVVVMIQIDRTDASSGGMSVFVATSDGTAVAGTDYTGYSGTANFGPYQPSTAVPIHITETALVNGPKTLTLTLTYPTNGYSVGTPSTATLTITDGWTPYDITYDVAESSTMKVSAGVGLLGQYLEELDSPYELTLPDPVSAPSNGTLTLGSADDGSFTYVPTSGFTGTDSFTYWMDDGMEKQMGTVTLNVVDPATAGGGEPASPEFITAGTLEYDFSSTSYTDQFTLNSVPIVVNNVAYTVRISR